MPNGNEGKPLASYLIQQMRRLRLDGMSVRRIAELAGVSAMTVQKYTNGLVHKADTPIPGAADEVEHDYSKGVREPRIVDAD